MNEAVRPRRDDVRQEPLLGGGRAAADPLAELARLVGQNDPYRNVFGSGAARPSPSDAERSWHASPEAHAGGNGTDDDDHVRHGEAWQEHGESVHEAEHGWAEDGEPAYATGPREDGDDRFYAADYPAHGNDAGIADEGAAADAASAAIPDLWARGNDRWPGAAPHVEGPPFGEDGRLPDRSAARRPLIALAAVLVLTGGGLAASFLARGNGVPGTAATARTAPTILAATGPTKVKQDDTAATAPEDHDAALLNKNSGAVSGPVKVVQSEEQPVDLGQLPRSDFTGAVGSAPQASSPFPEAKKVRTFVVHPDGTMLSEDGTSVPPASSPTAPAEAAAPVDAAPARSPAMPKAAANGATTPTPTTIASLAADAAVGDAQPAAPVKPARPQVASIAGASGFGLQLAASPSEADAHAAFAKLKRKYPAELGSLSANVHKSETGGKPVYRVRVGGMSREEAASLCTKLMAGGGSCFVVHD